MELDKIRYIPIICRFAMPRGLIEVMQIGGQEWRQGKTDTSFASPGRKMVLD
jgi:hypothetical protein